MIALAPLCASWMFGALLLGADGRKRWVATLAACGLLGVFALDVGLLVWGLGTSDAMLEVTTGGWPAGVGIRLSVDRIGLLFATTSAGVLTAVMIHERRVGVRSRLLPALLLLMCAGLHGAFFTRDLFNFYVFFEVSVVSSFALAAYGYGRAELRGTFTYVAVNLFGSALFLVGIASIYHSLGTLDFGQIVVRASAAESEPLVLSTTLLFVALALKLGLFPLHGWVPALYGNARPGVAAALAGALANIGAYGLLRVAMFLAETELVGSTAFVVLGAAAILHGGVLALSRESPAETAAYASVVHAGYVVLALGIGGPHGLVALLLVVVAGSIDKATMFMTLDASGRARETTSLLAAASMAGLPPTFSFVAKLALLRAALQASAPGAIALVVVAGSVLTLVAGVRFRRRVTQTRPMSGTASAMPIALASVSVLLTIWPEPVARFAAAIASSQLSGGSQ